MSDPETVPGAAGLVERLTAEVLLNPTAIAKKLGRLRGERAVHPSTVTRWCQHGIPVAGGTRVKLEAIKVGPRWASSWPAVLRFLAAQQQQPAADAPPVRTPRARTKASERAEAELIAAGC